MRSLQQRRTAAVHPTSLHETRKSRAPRKSTKPNGIFQRGFSTLKACLSSFTSWFSRKASTPAATPSTITPATTQSPTSQLSQLLSKINDIARYLPRGFMPIGMLSTLVHKVGAELGFVCGNFTGTDTGFSVSFRPPEGVNMSTLVNATQSLFGGMGATFFSCNGTIGNQVQDICSTSCAAPSVVTFNWVYENGGTAINPRAWIQPLKDQICGLIPNAFDNTSCLTPIQVAALATAASITLIGIIAFACFCRRDDRGHHQSAPCCNKA